MHGSSRQLPTIASKWLRIRTSSHGSALDFCANQNFCDCMLHHPLQLSPSLPLSLSLPLCPAFSVVLIWCLSGRQSADHACLGKRHAFDTAEIEREHVLTISRPWRTEQGYRRCVQRSHRQVWRILRAVCGYMRARCCPRPCRHGG